VERLRRGLAGARANLEAWAAALDPRQNNGIAVLDPLWARVVLLDKGGSMTPLPKRIDLELPEDEYTQLLHIAKERDCSVPELIYQVVRRTYIEHLGEEAATGESPGLGPSPLLLEEEDNIGIRGPGIVAEDGPGSV
jgi:hypothetical protein